MKNEVLFRLQQPEIKPPRNIIGWLTELSGNMSVCVSETHDLLLQEQAKGSLRSRAHFIRVSFL